MIYLHIFSTFVGLATFYVVFRVLQNMDGNQDRTIFGLPRIKQTPKQRSKSNKTHTMAKGKADRIISPSKQREINSIMTEMDDSYAVDTES